jgi:hypothetical protein
MQSLSRIQMAWLARGATLGAFLNRLLRALDAVATDGYVALGGGKLSKSS